MRGQDALRINIHDGDVLYHGIYIPLKILKRELLKRYPKTCHEYRLRSSRKFNSVTGEITYLYAWDSIIDELHSTFFDNDEDKLMSYISRLDIVLLDLINNINDN